ncbi:hypothetical protein GW17_00060124, partial [Ensete ventricosum]
EQGLRSAKDGKRQRLDRARKSTVAGKSGRRWLATGAGRSITDRCLHKCPHDTTLICKPTKGTSGDDANHCTPHTLASPTSDSSPQSSLAASPTFVLVVHDTTPIDQVPLVPDVDPLTKEQSGDSRPMIEHSGPPSRCVASAFPNKHSII